MPHLIEILLPVHDNAGRPFPRELYKGVARELTERFGGVTAFARSPGEGLWLDESAGARRDEVVVYEVMVEELDAGWWRTYRHQLEGWFHQEELVVRATAIARL